MDERTREALEASIRHWEENVKAARPGGASCAASECSLCGLFFLPDDDSKTCKGCPIFKHTGGIRCSDTPYVLAALGLEEWRELPSNGPAAERFHVAAQAEVDFLKSLRDPPQ